MSEPTSPHSITIHPPRSADPALRDAQDGSDGFDRAWFMGTWNVAWSTLPMWKVGEAWCCSLLCEAVGRDRAEVSSFRTRRVSRPMPPHRSVLDQFDLITQHDIRTVLHCIMTPTP